MNLKSALKELENLYKQLEKEVTPIEKIHAQRLNCKKGCFDCCVDEISVFEIEAENIKSRYAEFLKNEKAGPLGACAFLDKDGGCRIYEDRPYVCRTQGLPLRWIQEQKDGNYVELRDICPLNETDQKIEYLKPTECWLIGPFEEKLAQLQIQLDGGEFRRVELRSFFEK